MKMTRCPSAAVQWITGCCKASGVHVAETIVVQSRILALTLRIQRGPLARTTTLFLVLAPDRLMARLEMALSAKDIAPRVGVRKEEDERGGVNRLRMGVD